MSLSAMTYWAFTFSSDSFRLSIVGQISTLVGGAGIFVSAFVFNMSRSSEKTHHTFDRQVSFLTGGFRTFRRGASDAERCCRPRPLVPHAKNAPAWGTSDCRVSSVAAPSI
jgi:hypothetical protein